MSLMNANLENLKRCVRNNRNARHFDFQDVVHECGSYGCLLGNDIIAKLGVSTTFSGVYLACETFGFSSPSDMAHADYSLYKYTAISNWLFYEGNSQGDTREQRIARVEKTIAYIERKRQLLYDYESDGVTIKGVKELARKQEGDWMICPKISQSLTAAV